jgi:hypothetical protein
MLLHSGWASPPRRDDKKPSEKFKYTLNSEIGEPPVNKILAVSSSGGVVNKKRIATRFKNESARRAEPKALNIHVGKIAARGKKEEAQISENFRRKKPAGERLRRDCEKYFALAKPIWAHERNLADF